MNYFRILYFWFVVAFLATICSFGALTTRLIFWFDKKRVVPNIFSKIWARLLVLSYPWWKITLKGLEHLPAEKDGPFIYVANHASGVDIPVCYFIPRRFVWLSKRSLFKVPFLGWGMWATGSVPVERGNKDSHQKSLENSRKRLSEGLSIFFFPEGTRSANGVLKDFKLGAFRLSFVTGIPIIPVTLVNSYKLIRKGTVVPNPAQVDVIVHPILSPKDFADPVMMALAARTQIASALPEGLR